MLLRSSTGISKVAVRLGGIGREGEVALGERQALLVERPDDAGVAPVRGGAQDRGP